MTEAAVASEIHQALYVNLHLAAQVALDLIVGFEHITDLLDIRVRQLGRNLVLRDASLLADLSGGRRTDSVQVAKRDDDVLPVRKVDACNASQDYSWNSKRHLPPAKSDSDCERRSSLSSTTLRLVALALLVLRVLADHANHAAATDDLALRADFLDRRTHLHDVLSKFRELRPRHCRWSSVSCD